MVGVVLGISRQLQKLCLFHTYCIDLADRKRTLCQGAGFIEYHYLCMGQRFQIVTAFDKDADFGCTADAAKETKRNRDNQSAGAGNHQEGQRPVNPDREWLSSDKRRQNCKGNRCKDHNRGVVAGKTADKVFCFSFFIAGILHKVQNFCNSGFPILFSGLNGQDTCLVDAPADYFHPRFHVTGHGFAGESRCIQSGRAFDDPTIQRHPFTRLYYNRIPDVYFFRINLFKFSIPFYICIVRANVHQACNGFSGFGNRIGLEPFSYLIEQHNGYALRVFS